MFLALPECECARAESLTLSLCLFPDMYTASDTWTLLYNSAKHGQAGNRFQHHAYRYTGMYLCFLFRVVLKRVRLRHS